VPDVIRVQNHIGRVRKWVTTGYQRAIRVRPRQGVLALSGPDGFGGVLEPEISFEAFTAGIGQVLVSRMFGAHVVQEILDEIQHQESLHEAKLGRR
jgi:hypothetical protein